MTDRDKGGRTSEADTASASRRRFLQIGGAAGVGAVMAMSSIRPAAAAGPKPSDGKKKGEDGVSDPPPPDPKDENKNTGPLGQRGRFSPHKPKKPKRSRYLLLSQENNADGQTLLDSPDPDAAFVVTNATGTAIVGESMGSTFGQAAGVRGAASDAPGVEAVSDNVVALFATSLNKYAVQGIGDNYVGVLGQSLNGFGVQGIAGGETGQPGDPGNVGGEPAANPGTNGTVGVLGQARDPDQARAQGKGVHGLCDDANGAGVLGQSLDGFGVLGIGDNKVAVKGQSANGFGIHGVSATKVAILGETGGSDWGVIGRCAENGYGGISGFHPADGVGTEGVALGANGVGVHATNATPGGRALQVDGRAAFRSSGLIPVQSGDQTLTATVLDAVPGAIVLATVQGAPVGAEIAAASVTAPGTVGITLTGPATTAGLVGYLVVN